MPPMIPPSPRLSFALQAGAPLLPPLRRPWSRRDRSAPSPCAIWHFRMAAIALCVLSLSHSIRAESHPTVLTGIDVLQGDKFSLLQGLSIGLVTNQTGINRERRSTIDLLHEAPGVKLKALFSPEHG